MRDSGWDAIVRAFEHGATLMCSGWFEHDDAELPAERVGVERRALRMVEDMAGLDDRRDVWRFTRTLSESWYRADVPGPRRRRLGQGEVVHHPLPVEWAEPSPALARFYRLGLPGDLAPRSVLDGGTRPGLVVVTVPFRQAWLLVAINESASDQAVVGRRPRTRRPNPERGTRHPGPEVRV